MKNSLIHLAHYLKNPKLKLECFSIGDKGNGEECIRKLEALLLSLEHQISTKTFDHRDIPDTFFLVALKSFRPGVLEDMRGEADWDRLEVINEIVGTEQWKQAKRFLGGNMLAFADGFAHFEEFDMVWEDGEMKDVVRLKQILFKSPNFEKCSIAVDDDTGAMASKIVFGDYLLQEEDTSEFKMTYHYPIPPSTDYFEIKVLFASPNFEKCSILGYDNTSANAIKEEFGDYLLKDENTSELKQTYHYPIPNSAGYFEIRVEGHRFEVARKK
ncbi:hypothetical protein CAEBREN_07667 [Caenorhabditis brenneri]|uniref:DUF38 domain-containing protein n=1 Tax=Caenorhabditis brenneri TaxID=135651 RepID=G0NIF0_CAEBE|nr:hypothetical protein CAEBREN_07667 [Caenorhabditis brenneri]